MGYKLQKQNNDGKIKKKWKKNILIFTIIGTLIASVNSYFNRNKNNSNAPETTTENVTLYIDSGEDTPIKSTLNEVGISINSNSYDNFINYLNSVEENYEYSKYYQIDESLKKYNELKKVPDSKEDIRDNNGNISTQKLYDKVIQNNKEYLANGDTVITCFYQEMNNADVLKICDLVVEIVNLAIEKEQKLDIEKICSNLCKLKIFETNSSAGNMAQTTSDYCIKVSPSMMELYQSIHEEKDTTYEVFAHEVMHMLQSGYIELKNDGIIEISGPCVKFDGQEINPLYWSFMQEALAEIAMEKVTDHSATMYPNQRSYIDTLMLCNVLDDNTSVNDILNSTFDNNINDLFDFFGAKTDSEKKVIISMLYNIEVVEQRSPTEFINLYKKLYNIDLSQDKEKLNKVKQTLRCEVYVSISKMFYRNLITKIHNGGVTLGDVFYLIRVFEADMHSHLLYSEEDRFVDTTEFIEIYRGIQTSFFEAISKQLNKTTEDMYYELSNYSMLCYDENGNICYNYSLNFIDKKKRKFIEELQKKVYKTGIPNIVDVKKSSFLK